MPVDGRRHDAGQAVLLVVAVVVLLALVAGATARFGARLIAVQQAQIAADAAAIAGVERGEAAARQLAAENGAALVSFRGDVWEVTVVVRHSGLLATARASRAP